MRGGGILTARGGEGVTYAGRGGLSGKHIEKTIYYRDIYIYIYFANVM